MHFLVDLIQSYAFLAVFAAVFLDSAGVPIPSYPVLMVAAAATVSPTHSSQAAQMVLLGAAASLLADSALYWSGRQYGTKLLGMVCKVSLSPDSCARNTGSMYARMGTAALPLTKFFPGISTMAVVLAGATRISLSTFYILDTIGALLYVGGGILLGLIFHDAIDSAIATLSRWGEWGLITAGVLLGVFLLAKWTRRKLLIRQLKMDRITVNELRALMDQENGPTILDVRSAATRALQQGSIPGAITVDMATLEPGALKIPADGEVIVYCSCPNEVSAALVARQLHKAGFKKIRPLLGGIEAWEQAGYVVETGLRQAA